jgi:hypothetical protein
VSISSRLARAEAATAHMQPREPERNAAEWLELFEQIDASGEFCHEADFRPALAAYRKALAAWQAADPDAAATRPDPENYGAYRMPDDLAAAFGRVAGVNERAHLTVPALRGESPARGMAEAFALRLWLNQHQKQLERAEADGRITLTTGDRVTYRELANAMDAVALHDGNNRGPMEVEALRDRGRVADRPPPDPPVTAAHG